jgi:hypothetical protein
MTRILLVILMMSVFTVSVNKVSAQSDRDKIEELKSKIFLALDSIAQTDNYIFVKGDKRYPINSGEFAINHNNNELEYYGTFLLDKYLITKSEITYYSFKPKGHFCITKNLFIHNQIDKNQAETLLVNLLNHIKK